MRRIVRLVIVLSVLAGLRRARCRRSRAHVDRLPRRSELPLGRRPRSPASQGASQTNATIMRLLVQWNLVAKNAAVEPDELVRPRVQLRRHRRGRARGAGERPGGHPDALRHAEVGQRRQEPERDADAESRTSRTSRARSPLATRAGSRGYPFVRFFSVWNEPNLQLFLAPQFNAQGKSVAPANYAKLAAAAYTGIKAGSRAGAGRDRRDVGARKRQADGPASDAHARASSPSSSRRRTRASGSTRGRIIRTRSTRTRLRRSASSGRTCRSLCSRASTPS